jgi:hypothetical protein
MPFIGCFLESCAARVCDSRCPSAQRVVVADMNESIMRMYYMTKSYNNLIPASSTVVSLVTHPRTSRGVEIIIHVINRVS